MDTGGVHQAGDLHAGGLGEIGDRVAGVQHIAADADGLVGDHGLHDVGGVLAGALVPQVGVGEQTLGHILPALDLADAAPGILVQGDVVAVDQLRIILFNIEGIVFGVMLAGFGAVVA